MTTPTDAEIEHALSDFDVIAQAHPAPASREIAVQAARIIRHLRDRLATAEKRYEEAVWKDREYPVGASDTKEGE